MEEVVTHCKAHKSFTANDKQFKGAQCHNAIVRKFGVCIPRNVHEAKMLDEENGNTLWMDAIKLELKWLQDCNAHRSVGSDACIPPGHKQIPVKMAFDVKQWVKRKARLVARGDKTAPPCESVCSGIASLQSLQIVCFLAD